MNPPKMPIHIGDYKRDTGHLRAAGHGAYLLLLFHHWSTGSLPDDDEQLAAISCMTKQEWKKMKPIIAKFFDPGWVHGRVVDDLADAKESYEKLSAAGSKGGKARAENKRRLSEAISDDTSEASSDATSSVNLPLTFNQGKKDSEAKASAPNGAEITEAEVYRFGRKVLGKNSGGVITEIRNHCKQDLRSVFDLLEQAETKGFPMQWVQGVLRGTERADVPEHQLFPPGIYENVL